MAGEMSNTKPGSTQLDAKRQQLKDEYTAAKGFWPEMHNALLQLDPDFLRAYMQYGFATTAKAALDAKTRELIYIAVDAATTHLYNAGTRNHMRMALKLGATTEEIMEVLKIVTGLGMHTTTESVPILLEILKETGQHKEIGLDAKRQQLKKEYTAAKGFWPEMHNALLELDPDFLRAYMQYGFATTVKEALDAKMRELIYIAVDASTTHLYNAGTRNHMRMALKLGATIDEIMEVLKIVTGLGMHTTTESVPILVEVLKEIDDERASAKR
jgi:alkylhydroperoxidase/carboxymuconolactone decarboxylase family protein YurZ